MYWQEQNEVYEANVSGSIHPRPLERSVSVFYTNCRGQVDDHLIVNYSNFLLRIDRLARIVYFEHTAVLK